MFMRCLLKLNLTVYMNAIAESPGITGNAGFPILPLTHIFHDIVTHLRFLKYVLS